MSNDQNIELITQRIEVFSDGIFAIAITLLYLLPPKKPIYRQLQL